MFVTVRFQPSLIFVDKDGIEPDRVEFNEARLPALLENIRLGWKELSVTKIQDSYN